MTRRQRDVEDAAAAGDAGESWPEHVPAAERRQRAAASLAAMLREGQAPQPVSAASRRITNSFWGQAWCRHLQAHSDYASRLPRGRAYLRDGCVVDLRVVPGRIEAHVQGTRLYQVVVRITPLEAERWLALADRCQGEVESLLDLLAGKLAGPVMATFADPDAGLFPAPGEIRLSCTCPDTADLCKHTAAVLYGVGARLDEQPELLFTLRGGDHRELLAGALAAGLSPPATAETLVSGDLSELFGLDLDLP